MSPDSADGDVNLSLTQDEALVLFEWLATFNKTEYQFVDQAERRVLWDLEARLESTLTAPFRDDYLNVVAAARARLRDSSD